MLFSSRRFLSLCFNVHKLVPFACDKTKPIIQPGELFVNPSSASFLTDSFFRYHCEWVCVYVCIDMYVLNPQENEWLSGFADEPLCTVLSNNHNFHLTGKWYDEKCSESGYGFVCQKPQGKIPSVSLSLVSVTVCLFTASLNVFQHVCLSLLLSDHSSFLMLNGVYYTSLINYSLCK